MVLRKLKLYWSMVRYGMAHNRDFAREHWAFFKRMRDELAWRGVTFDNKRILDVGCGKSCWLTLLFHSAGAKTTGLDVEVVKPGFSISKYERMFRKNGFERTARTLVWELAFAGPYYRQLGREADMELRVEGVDARAMSVEAMEFEDNTFDLVVSHEVFEHLPDVDAALAEIKRVMKLDGVTYLYIHNYASISGGHHIAWKYPDAEPSDIVPPWDHLRENRFPEIPSWINRMREGEFRDLFEKRFDILDWYPHSFEGESLLTPEIEAELVNYSREELLTKGFVVVAKPIAGE